MVSEMEQSPHQSDVALVVDASVSEHDLFGPGYGCEVTKPTISA